MRTVAHHLVLTGVRCGSRKRSRTDAMFAALLPARPSRSLNASARASTFDRWNRGAYLRLVGVVQYCAVIGFTGIAQHSVDSCPSVPLDGARGCARAISTPSRRRSVSPHQTHSEIPCCHRGSTSVALPTSRVALASACGSAQQPSFGPDHYDSSVLTAADATSVDRADGLVRDGYYRCLNQASEMYAGVLDRSLQHSRSSRRSTRAALFGACAGRSSRAPCDFFGAARSRWVPCGSVGSYFGNRSTNRALSFAKTASALRRDKLPGSEARVAIQSDRHELWRRSCRTPRLIEPNERCATRADTALTSSTCAPAGSALTRPAARSGDAGRRLPESR